MEEGKEEERRKDFHRGVEGIKFGQLFGDDHFVDKDLERIGQAPQLKADINSIIEEVCNLYQLSKKDLIASGKGRLASEARAVSAWVIREIPSLSLTELSLCFKRDVTTLSLAIERMLSRTEKNSKLRNNLNKIAKKYKIQ